ncbi:acyltransferase domain-containing protein [Buchnera aphidicola (Pseudoregma panicola)]|uniref:acyltransferase domain-containing protein n=1 Tax=Buchnera aphidicola TaxID=9 RepID=UPI0031B707FC
MKKKINFSIIFPGQSKYNKNRLMKLYKYDNSIKNTFEKASEIIKYNIWKNIYENSIKKIKNRYFQPIIITISIAIYKLFIKHINIKPKIIAGHSLGEYSSLICSNSISFKNCLLLIKARGKLMEKVSKKKFSTKLIFGLTEEKVTKICKKCSYNNIVEISSINSKKIITITGDSKSVKLAVKLCKINKSKKILSVPISVPVHCNMLKSIKNKYFNLLKKINFKNPIFNIINNIDAKNIYKKNNIKKYLCKQLYKKVKWKECIDYIIKKNVKLFIEMSTNKIFIKENNNFIKTITINSKKNILYARKIITK